MPYLGKTPSQATRKRYYLTASGGETSISGTMTTGGTLTFNDGEFVDVSVNGVALVAGTDYNTTTANTIGGLSALTASDQVEIIVYDTFSVFGGNVDGDFTINSGTLTAGTTSLDGAVTINESSADVDFRVESNGNANMLFVDGGNDRVGIGTGSPGAELDIESTGPNIHLNDSDGVLGGAITSRVVMQASGSTHGIVGFGTSGGTMAVTNAQGDLFLQADTNNSHSSSAIKFTVDNTERARLNASGIFLVGKTSASATGTGVILDRNGQSFFGADTEPPIVVNRNNNDGNLVLFMQADSVEGTISVSGTTVSYNGGHLSRWSQATDGNRIDGLVKGTVMTNLDQMAVWSHAATEAVDAVVDADGNVVTEAVEAKDAYTEANEQLNCMAVSSVEGDTNVAGVFVNWDEDDDFNDMNVAMTGDMVIRIAQGTTVERGNLLMSAGDGTAKPQGDGYVQDKTIAKVTSTTVSHTYDDGSYLVPCVLMAC